MVCVEVNGLNIRLEQSVFELQQAIEVWTQQSVILRLLTVSFPDTVAPALWRTTTWEQSRLCKVCRRQPSDLSTGPRRSLLSCNSNNLNLTRTNKNAHFLLFFIVFSDFRKVFKMFYLVTFASLSHLKHFLSWCATREAEWWPWTSGRTNNMHVCGYIIYTEK